MISSCLQRLLENGRTFYRRYQNNKKLQKFHSVLASNQGYFIAEAARKQRRFNQFAYFYGEICPLSFMQIVADSQASEQAVFVDLGAGLGKAVFTASLAFPFRCCLGIEQLSDMVAVSNKYLAEFRTIASAHNIVLPEIQLTEGNLLTAGYQHADVVFINATAFFGELWEAVVNNMLQLSANSTVIVVSKKLPADNFQLLQERRYAMSWGMATTRFYRRCTEKKLIEPL